MTIKYPSIKFGAYLFLVAWLFTFGFCGGSSFYQSFHVFPHHASQSTSPDCEQVCLSKNVFFQNVALGSLDFKPFQPDLRSSFSLGLNSENRELAGNFNRLNLPRGSTKRYQLFSVYRI